jgi:REP element-mobilizing transposase RayT
MKIEFDLLRQIESDLGLDVPFVRGRMIPIKNCWHFSTDGDAVDSIFQDEEDFRAGMNRVYVVVKKYRVIILAFALMDTHLHFILHGALDECNRFMHDYVRRTSQQIALKYGARHKLDGVPIHHQTIDTDAYLKTAICYVIKNPPVGGIAYTAWNYPWSSGPLYFCRAGLWSSPAWCNDRASVSSSQLTQLELIRILKVREVPEGDVRIVNGMVFPGEYVAYELVERLFKTCRSFNYFFCITKEEDVEARGGAISHLSIPMQEMRQHKNEVCRELFGTESIRSLSTEQRLRLAKVLKSRYNSSLKQIIRLSGLRYEEVKSLL